MILFFGDTQIEIFAVSSDRLLSQIDQEKLSWLFGNVPLMEQKQVEGDYVGPRATMISPWSTNAVEITQNMGIAGIDRIERFIPLHPGSSPDPMLFQVFSGLNQHLFEIDIQPEPIRAIEDIASYNKEEGLSLSEEEVAYLHQLSEKMGRPLTDSEVFGFSQVNSEHCRHKIFNGAFVVDGQEMPHSLFQLIKLTSKANPGNLVSAYKDNVAFVKGPDVVQFAPERGNVPSSYQKQPVSTVISLKAETHNFPTTVEPFNGAATGSGGEIRDRMAGGQGAIPLAGTAVYMTAYPRLGEKRTWVDGMKPRPWLYQKPIDILIRASDGASDFGNKFGQPLICGSVLTFEHEEYGRKLGFDKVIMLAGGIGYARAEQAQKKHPEPGDRIVILGGDNYRIGMGGAAVSSADTGAFSSGLELNAVQRSNPEMQKRVANAIRAMIESKENLIISIHDHGAGGHLNCLSELVEETGGVIDTDKLPVGDPTLSMRELIGNESQERMGLIVHEQDLPLLREISERERAPIYDVGEVTGDHRFVFRSGKTGERPMDLNLEDMFGSSPRTVLVDQQISRTYKDFEYQAGELNTYIKDVLRLEAVACKDWLTNKVDRCVGGRVSTQQCVGPLQLPLNNCGVMALDFDGREGVATSVGHAPLIGLVDPAAGARVAVAEALTNLIWAPLQGGLASVSLSANWMWPCKNLGEDARLYAAVQSISDFAIALGINIPTGKDSLSMKQKYDEEEVIAPGTVVVSTVGHCSDITKVVEPLVKPGGGDLYYINFSGTPYGLGGSSFAQTRNRIGSEVPDVADPEVFANTFQAVQDLINNDLVLAGHDVSAGGLLTTLLEMCFAGENLGMALDLTSLRAGDTVKLLLSENAGIVLQARNREVETILEAKQIPCHRIGKVTSTDRIIIVNGSDTHVFPVSELRDVWYETSWLLDSRQTTPALARARFDNYKLQPHQYIFPEDHDGALPEVPDTIRPRAAVLREKGSNSERELAHALYLAGFEVRDVHMTDLISGRETLEDIRFLGAVGGFSNSDVLGSAKGWAGAFLYNEKAKSALDRFFRRDDVLSIGICNGCQLFMELGLIEPESGAHMALNDSGKHESAFTSVKIDAGNAVMLEGLDQTNLGVWISHGEGKFVLPGEMGDYNIVGRYAYSAYPSNPNGSDFDTAMLCSKDGRHLVTMPHIERSIYSWNWANYPDDRPDRVSPWLRAFINARKWLVKDL